MRSSPAFVYRDQAVHTADGPSLLIMLCDRLVADMSRAEIALLTQDFKIGDENFLHAQSILRLLRGSLDPTGFEGGNELAAVYQYLENQLVRANLEKDVALLRECSSLFDQIHQAWRAAVNRNAGSNVYTNLE